MEGLALGDLPVESFRHYLVQDYLFLIHFARAYGLAVFKSGSLAEMRRSHEGLKAILDVEMDLHVRLCAGWGISAEELERTPEAKETTAYTRTVLEAGLRGDLLDLKVALAPCVIGYAEIARDLAGRPEALDASNPYHGWIAEYCGEAYQDLAREARRELDTLAADAMSETRFARLAALFRQACLLEADFWEMGFRHRTGS